MIAAFNKCKRCSEIPSRLSVDLLDKDNTGIPKEVQDLPGMSEVDLSRGYQTWEMMCNLCGTSYKGEIDVEPFVWDFSLERLEK
ncbi:TPA: hypothetical protein DEB00_01910 [Candidatus Uhrbacteria bacterium]|nr:hypothetical protein [Candidatus Uhrbacteria bacterium]